MQIVFVDESGTSADEPVVVVAGVMIDLERDGDGALAAMAKVVSDWVPAEYQAGFYVHASKLQKNDNIWRAWPLYNRFRFLVEFMKIPKLLNLPIVFGVQRKNFEQWRGIAIEAGMNDKDAQHYIRNVDHYLAFETCVSRIDHWLRNHGEDHEKAIVVHESLPSHKIPLRRMLDNLRESPKLFSARDLRWTENEMRTGILRQSPYVAAERIFESMLFADKDEAKLLQMADVAAFGLRRYFGDMRFGQDYLDALSAHPLVRSDWDGPGSGGILWGGPTR